MARRTGIQPSELMAYPLVFEALLEDLQQADEDDAIAARRAKTQALLRQSRG